MIQIIWSLGSESGIHTAKNDKEAEKFNKGLYAKKLALIELTPGQMEKLRDRPYKNDNQIKIDILKNNPLKVTFQRI
jgi:hypothetical protein